MRTIPKWVDKIQDTEKTEQCIYDLCFNPEGTQLVVASGQRVLVYDTTNGTLIQPLRGHKDVVYCVAYARDGKKFASGSADKTVIIWNSKLEGILKYSHGDAIQCLAYNPLSHQLASCALSDFAFWSTDQKAVQKHKVSARINSCSWTNDGQYLALGLGNGTISIRNRLGEEKGRVDRHDKTNPNTPLPQIWALSWSPSKEEDILCVTDWNNNLAFYTLGGQLVGKERQIGFQALKTRYFPNAEYILICGTNKICSMYTKEGIKLGTIGDTQQSWIWGCAVHPNSNYIALGCQDGTLSYYQLVFNTVHGLYKERYAFRENMTDVIIQHLLTEQKVRIKCRDLIKKIAIYKHRLAVQLPERVVIYELYSGDTNDMHYRVREKITQRLECNLLVVCTKHLVICQEMKLQCVTFTGQREREWLLDSPIRYIKVVGGPAGQEGLVLGLKNGQVWKIYLDNAFPILLVTAPSAVRCLDLSSHREKLAVVDENGLCQVFNANTGELLFQEFNTNSVSFNTNYEDMLAFSGNNSLGIKVADFPAHRQKLSGFVVGLTGSQVFCLNGATMTTIELPLSAPMYQYIEKRMFNEAHEVACLGVTNGDWEELGFCALENLELEVAKYAFVRLQNYTYLELIHDLQERQKKGEANEVLIGDVLAYRGRFRDAARMYQKAGQEQKALTMYTDLRMFDLAQDYLGSGDHKTLIRQKAEWAKNINEPKAAADMYLSIGDTKAAIDILGENRWVDQLIDLGRRLDKVDRDSLLNIAEHLKQLQQTGAAAELYHRLGDSAAVLKLHVEAREWSEAFTLAEQQPQHKALVYVPYAHWLAENDKFVQAQKAFHKAGCPDEAFRVLEQLTDNAVEECRFQDAGYYYWILSRQCLDLASLNSQHQNEMLCNFYENERLAGIYYTYHVIHRYLEEPFTSYMAEGLFNIARYLINETLEQKPKGISLFAVMYTLSKQARILGANKLAKQLLDKIQSLRIPARYLEQVEIATLAAKAKPFSDSEELLPMCYRCSTYNPLMASKNTCNNCGQKFVYSFFSFELLPLVEFELEKGINDTEAIRLIESPPNSSETNDNDGWVQEVSEDTQMLQMGDDNNEGVIDDPFTARLLTLENGDGNYAPLTVNRSTLLAMESSTVLICKWQPPLRYKYYRNLLPDVPITLCNTCFKAFHVDDFELQVLQKGYCPFCRTPPEVHEIVESDDYLSMY